MRILSRLFEPLETLDVCRGCVCLCVYAFPGSPGARTARFARKKFRENLELGKKVKFVG